jgi:hypothetical protein
LDPTGAFSASTFFFGANAGGVIQRFASDGDFSTFHLLAAGLSAAITS